MNELLAEWRDMGTDSRPLGTCVGVEERASVQMVTPLVMVGWAALRTALCIVVSTNEMGFKDWFWGLVLRSETPGWGILDVHLGSTLEEGLWG